VTLARCPRCGGEMVPFPVDRETVIWMCLQCPEVRVQMPDLWRWAAERGRKALEPKEAEAR
jgi:hypothetical protein